MFTEVAIMLCFFCYTPFHVFNSISIMHCYYKDKEADLYLYNSETGGTKALYESLCGLGLFKNVFLVDNVWWTEETRWEKILRKRLHIKTNKKNKNTLKNYKTIKKRKRIYDIVWSYGSATEMYLLLGVSLRKNKQALYLGYEEGEGSYRLPCTNVLQQDEIEFLRNQLKIEMPEKPNKMLLYLPSCVSPIVTAPIEEMPKVTRQLVEKVYSKVWNFSSSLLHYDVFFMALGDYDQSFTFSLYDDLKEYDNIRITVKAHPRYIDPFIGKDIDLLECGTTPWEVVCGNIEDLDSKLLIGVYSTALVTAKSVYGKEPFIIFLNDMDILEDKHRISQEKERFLKLFIETYTDRSKMAFPKNIDELKKSIDLWYKNRRLTNL